MSQLFSLYGDLTVDENITFFSRLYGVPGRRRAERRDWVLQMAGLTDKQDRLTSELPLGWKQRLALGCAILHQPPILFLDEPTSGVDPTSRRNFWELIYSLAEQGTTVFVTTHYMEEAEYCHRLALMNRGRLIALDTPANLRAQSKEPLFEVEVDDSPGAIHALQEAPGILEVALFGRAVHVTVSSAEDAPERIGERLSTHGIELRKISRIDPSLEDVFAARVRAEGGAPVD
jgi:ABC-2 type transport system ATP-binding protein